MSLCGELKSDAITRRQNDLTNCARGHRDNLRALLAVHAIVKNNTSPSLLQNASFDATPSLKSEIEFLDEYDLSRGRIFDATKLTIPFHPAPLHNQREASLIASNPSKIVSAGADQSAPVTKHGDAAATPTNKSDALSNAHAPPRSREHGNIDSAVKPGAERTSSLAGNDSMSTSSKAINTALLNGDKASPAGPTIQQAIPSAPAKVVHLPNEQAQEESLRQRKAAEARLQAAPSEVTALHHSPRPPTHASADAPSSPSSTVGPQSAATPRPLEESPDTSPDSERPEVDEVLPPPELRPSPEERRAKEQHDRLHVAQMELARKQALGDVNTPDDQLKWEEQAAAAREAGETAGSRDRSFDEQSAQEKVTSKAKEGGGSSTDVDRSTDRKLPAPGSLARQTHTALQNKDAHPTVTPIREGKGNSQDDQPAAVQQGETLRQLEHARHDSDTIVVTPRMRSGKSESPDRVRTGQHKSTPALLSLAKHTSASDAKHPRLEPKVGSFVSASAAMLDVSSQSLVGRKQRPRLELSTASPSLSSSVLRALAPRSQLQPRASAGSDAAAALEQLNALKGAAGDPEKDYLEPLFRIQAHDSPNNALSKSLPDLVRMAHKALSTEDHMTTLHERVDFRMLRRIYQLQNANKWSLRQMEKTKEIEVPMSHHDYLMAEMKTMRRDFQAERKMKKSVCAWLAQRCAQWVGAPPEERLKLQVRRKQRPCEQDSEQGDDQIPELDQAGESANEDDVSPPTPRELLDVSGTLIVSPDLLVPVRELSHAGKLEKVLGSLPRVGIAHWSSQPKPLDMVPVSKFVEGRVLPSAKAPTRKRSRYSYIDEEEVLQAQPALKRRRAEVLRETIVSECALFDPENKQMRERIRSSTSFRPPLDILMPSTSFYENRNGSQWTWEDDQRVRSLAKEYTFNWSLIADELTIPGCYKSSYDRRTPWECFERWVELESLPAEMRKTPYFKTWFQRLETSAQTAERRYQAQVALLQQQAQQNSTTPRELPRRKLTPNRVEKRKGARYLWIVDGCRKIAKKREQQAWKVAEAARTAAQRKTQPDPNPQRQLLTPQEISKKRHQQDLATQAALREQRQKFHEQQQRMLQARLVQQQQQHQQQQAQQQMQQQAQQGSHHMQAQQITNNQGPPQQQHLRQQPGTPNMLAQQAQMQANGQQLVNMNGQTMQHPQQQGRQPMPIGAQNGYRVMPENRQHMNGPAQLQQQQARAAMAQHGNLQQQMAHAQARNAQFAGQSLQMASPGGRTPQQHQQQQQAILAAFNAQQQQQQQAAQAANANNQHVTNGTPNVSGQQQQMASASPSMPPPPTPQQQQHLPQQLSSGHIPQIIQLKNQLRASNPNLSDDQLTQLATQQMQIKSQQQQAQHQQQPSSLQQQQARQSAMNAAAGITTTPTATGQPAYGQPKHSPAPQPNAYTPNMAQMANGTGANGMYNLANGDSNNAGGQQQALGQQHAAISPAVMAAAAQAAAAASANGSPSQAQTQAYAQKMWQRQMAQMQQRQQAQQQQQQQQPPQQSPHQSHASPNVVHARLAASNGNSPGGMQASPNIAHARLAANTNGNNSPVVAHASPNIAQARLAGGAGNNGSSPSIAHASPSMTPVSPAAIAQMGSPYPVGAATPTQGQQRPTSRSATTAPQMQRLGSSSSMQGVLQGSPRGMPSPGPAGVIGQNSPRTVQASMAR